MWGNDFYIPSSWWYNSNELERGCVSWDCWDNDNECRPTIGNNDDGKVSREWEKNIKVHAREELFFSSSSLLLDSQQWDLYNQHFLTLHKNFRLKTFAIVFFFSFCFTLIQSRSRSLPVTTAVDSDSCNENDKQREIREKLLSEIRLSRRSRRRKKLKLP